jgi:hypothetical protein
VGLERLGRVARIKVVKELAKEDLLEFGNNESASST